MGFCSLLVLNLSQSWYAIKNLIGMETKLTEEVFLDIFFKYLGSSISWCSKKQMAVALSTCEADYIVGPLTTYQVVWILNLMQDLKIKVSKHVKLMIDNKSSISIAKNPVLHGRSKNIDTKFHFLHN